MFEVIGLTSMIVQRKVVGISEDIEIQFSWVFNSSVYYSFTVAELTDITSTVQLYIFARGVIFHFEIFQKLVELNSLQGQTKDRVSF